MAQSLGANAPQETDSLVKNATGRAKSTVLASAIEAATLAKNDALAQRWLNQLLIVYKNGSTQNPNLSSTGSVFDVGKAARLMIELVGPKDPDRALKLAHIIDDPNQTALALMVAAYYQPKQTKLATLKEAFELQWSVSSNFLPRMAGLVYDISPTQGAALFDRLLERYHQQRQDHLVGLTRRLNPSDLAYLLARYKPITSWQITQNAYVKEKANSRITGNGYTDVAVAMSVLDFNEAMQWARLMTSKKGRNYGAQRKLLQLALATPEVRRNRLSASGTWMP